MVKSWMLAHCSPFILSRDDCKLSTLPSLVRPVGIEDRKKVFGWKGEFRCPLWARCGRCCIRSRQRAFLFGGILCTVVLRVSSRSASPTHPRGDLASSVSFHVPLRV